MNANFSSNVAKNRNICWNFGTDKAILLNFLGQNGDSININVHYECSHMIERRETSLCMGRGISLVCMYERVLGTSKTSIDNR